MKLSLIKISTEHLLLELQLVCFYFVLTTFTTVGYGKLKIAFFFFLLLQSLSNPTGDIFALSAGERVRLLFCTVSFAFYSFLTFYIL